MTMRKEAIVELGRDGVPAEDFDAWVAFVAARIGAQVEMPVSVGERARRDVQIDAIDVVYGEPADVEEVAEAVSALWGEFCAGVR